MQKIELEIIALSDSHTNNNSFAVVLAEIHGSRRLPVIIGAYEAQSIAIYIERMRPSRPLTHDLFTDFATHFNINIVSVYISELRDGVFYSQLTCKQGDKSIEIDARTSDALALAMRFKCPIYTNSEVMEIAGIYIENERKVNPGVSTDKSTVPATRPGNSRRSLSQLQKMLDKAIAQEDYEEAAKIRDEMDQKKQNL